MPSPTHFYLRRGAISLADRTGRTTALPPWPYAWNTCVRAEADALAAELNAELSPHAIPWTVKRLVTDSGEISAEPAATEAADHPIAA